MIVPGPATRIFLVPGITDLCRSFDGLHGLVCSQLAEDPLLGHLFLFCNKSRNRLKVQCFEGTGLWVYAKRHASCCPHREVGEAALPLSPSIWEGDRSLGFCKRAENLSGITELQAPNREGKG